MSEYKKELAKTRAEIEILERLKNISYGQTDRLIVLKRLEAELSYKISRGERTFLESIGDWFEEHI